MAFQPGVFQADAFQDAAGEPRGALGATIAPVFVAALAGTVLVSGALAASFQPAFATSISGSPTVAGALHASFSPAFLASFAGDSDGTIIVIPRDVTGGISYLVEIGAYDTAAETEVTLRYGSKGFNTLPTDIPPNAFYEPRIDVPGDYSRTMFADGTTSGSLQVGTGVIELKNPDGGLDELIDHAFDGRTLRILTVETERPIYADAVLVFEGTVEQVEFTWGKVTVRIRDRLTELDRPIQEAKFAGTTISGGMDEAEGGPDDIKGQPKPLTFGVPRNVPAVESNRFDRIYDLGAAGLSSVAKVRDKGVELTAGADYATVAALRTASIPSGQYATANAVGLIRTGSVPEGQITVDPVEGPTAADRTAAQIARRILLRMGLVENSDFLAADIMALDALNSAEIGYWIGSEERTALQAIGDVLGSISATIVPDRLGIFRILRFDPPSALPVLTLTEAEIIEAAGRGIERLTTGDQGRGVPAWRVNLRYAMNYHVMSKSELDPVEATDAFKAFVNEEWRTVTAEDATVKDVHLLSPELTFDTWLVEEAAAQAEADRRLAMHSVRRDRFRVPVKSFLVEEVDIGSVVALQIQRFGLSAGKSFSVIGIAENFETGITTLDLWG